MTLDERFEAMATATGMVVLDAVRHNAMDQPILLAAYPDRVEAIDVLDDRQHLYLMRAAVKATPEVHGFIFFGYASLLFQQADAYPKVELALIAVTVRRDKVDATAHVVRKTWQHGITLDQPIPAPASAFEAYRTVFTDEPLPSGLSPL